MPRTKKKFEAFLEEYKDSTLEEVIELRESFKLLEKLNDNDLIPERLDDEVHQCMLIIHYPDTPQYPLEWKEFIPDILQEDLSAILDNVSENDLIYGLHYSRVKLFSIFENNARENLSVKTEDFYHATVDPYLNAIVCKGHSTDIFADKAHAFKDFAGIFKDEINSFSPSLMYGGNNPFIKKMSKLGILWTLSGDNKIHFVLNRIDYKMCFEKKFDKITFAELRFIYRNWEQLKPYYEKNQINFYFKDGDKLLKVKAPWESKPELVKNYQPKKTNQNNYLSFFDNTWKEKQRQKQDKVTEEPDFNNVSEEMSEESQEESSTDASNSQDVYSAIIRAITLLTLPIMLLVALIALPVKALADLFNSQEDASQAPESTRQMQIM